MTEDQRGKGRPKGKKSNPEYTTLTTYIKITTYKALKKKCVDLDVEMSEIVQELLDRWLSDSDHQ
jgi:hypothetical protein